MHFGGKFFSAGENIFQAEITSKVIFHTHSNRAE
jgi:hypothetical protein